MTTSTQPERTLDLSLIGVRSYRGISGQTYREIHRDESTVTLLGDYPVRGEKTLTIPLAMLQAFFVEL